jgi:probable F420-dependent oxidoreductase
MRYGVMIPNWAPYDQRRIIDLALEAEALGFEHAFVSDHLLNPYKAQTGGAEGAVEVYTLLSYLAAKTTTIRLGTSVTPISMRPIGLLAKQVATLDNLSGGRVDLGVGAGWAEVSYRTAEAEFGTALSRRHQLAEGIDVLKRLWSEDSVTFHGDYFRLEDAAIWPKPVQFPRPRIMVGAHGPKMLELTAEVADGWVPWNRPVDAYASMISELKSQVEAAGRKPSELMYAQFNSVVPDRLAADIASKPKFLVKPGYANTTVGTAQKMAQGYEEAGAELWVVLPFPPEEASSIIRSVARELIG